MDARRSPLAEPRVRQVGFFTPGPPPNRTQSSPPDPTTPPFSESLAANSLSPVIIPPARRHSANLSSRALPVPVPDSAFRRHDSGVYALNIGSYNQEESLLSASPSLSIGGANEGGLSEDSVSFFGFQRSNSNSARVASSYPSGGFDLTTVVKAEENAPPEKNTAQIVNSATARESKERNHIPEKQRGKDPKKDPPPSNSKPLKAKTTKAERRLLQESQRAAKAAAKGEASKSGATPGKSSKQHPQKKDDQQPVASSSVNPEKKADRAPEKEKKKEIPPTRMQFDDKSRVEKAKRRSVVNQTETKNRVELFRHLPQFERGTQFPDLQGKFFHLDSIHHAVYKVGLQLLSGDISGGNARCVAMLQAFQEAIKDYSTPLEKTLNRDLTAKISSYVSYLSECRPLSISMGNAIRFLKARILKLPLNLPESEAKVNLCLDIDRFINEKIILADKVIVRHAVTKIRNDDVLLIYGRSHVVEMILLYAHESGKQFRVVVVDSRPMLEGQRLMKTLLAKGLSCTYTHINAVSYIMHEVTRVFLGASSILSNGTVYSRVGTACVAMVAHEFQVPVLVCCEAYKFHERVQLDSICFNELGDSTILQKIAGRPDVKYLEENTSKRNLQLMYDTTPSEYISMIVTDYGMVPTTSVPVIVREYRRENLLL